MIAAFADKMTLIDLTTLHGPIPTMPSVVSLRVAWKMVHWIYGAPISCLPLLGRLDFCSNRTVHYG